MTDTTQRIDLVGDDFSDLDDLDEVSTLELLRQRVAQTKAQEDVVWVVPRRDGVKVRYSTIITPAKLNKLMARCSDKRNNFDTDLYTSLILATQCTGILIDDKPVEDDGKALTLRDRAILDLFGAAKAVDAVRRCYGATDAQPDGYALDVQNHANALLAAAGFNDKLAVADEEDEEGPPDR